MDFDAKYQMSKDGPLTEAFRARIRALRPDYTLAQIGELTGFSGAFISQLLKIDDPAHVRSLHIPRFAKAIESAEVRKGFVEMSPTSSDQPKTPPSETEDTLAEHIRAIHRLGFNVTLIPREK